MIGDFIIWTFSFILLLIFIVGFKLIQQRVISYCIGCGWTTENVRYLPTYDYYGKTDRKVPVCDRCNKRKKLEEDISKHLVDFSSKDLDGEIVQMVDDCFWELF